MTWRDLIRSASSTLARAGVDSPDVDARLLAEHVAGQKLMVAPDPSGHDIDTFLSLIERRAQRVPLQHLTGVMYFRYLELPAEEGVFIVRPETELLAGWAIEEAHRLADPVVLDLCTGSGAIALSIATEAKARVYAVELEDAPFAAATRTCADRVTVVQGDAREALEELAGSVDILVTNPPYVPPGEVSAEAAFDPDAALWGGGVDGTEFPIAMIDRARHMLKPGGLFLMEHDASHADVLADYASTVLTEVEIRQDLTGRPRFLAARQGL